MFKGSIHNNIAIFIISQDDFELPEHTIQNGGSVYHFFKPNNFREIQHLYQDKASMAILLNENFSLTSAGWIEKYQPLTIDMTKDGSTGRYCLGLNSLIVPHTNFIQAK